MKEPFSPEQITENKKEKTRVHTQKLHRRDLQTKTSPRAHAEKPARRTTQTPLPCRVYTTP